MLKQAARLALHRMGGLPVLRWNNRSRFGVAVFHAFSAADRPNVEAYCSHITRNFEPVSLSAIVDALEGGGELPKNAIHITIDDGYRNFLLHGHPIFHRYKIPTTLYVVSGFAAGRLWLWPDRIAYGIANTPLHSLKAQVNEWTELNLTFRTPEERTAEAFRLAVALTQVSNAARLAFLEAFGQLCRVDFPDQPPDDRAAMTWDELRAVAAENVEIGCHSGTHPILSRQLTAAELDQEIQGAKQEMEQHLRFPVLHFCYPNGQPADIGDASIQAVRTAGFRSAVTCSQGLNTLQADRFQIRRILLDSTLDRQYGVELLAGLHM
jgi:peptidoglycan/xylan/chitin deacetylase (PgdA/CDA1 family)